MVRLRSPTGKSEKRCAERSRSMMVRQAHQPEKVKSDVLSVAEA